MTFGVIGKFGGRQEVVNILKNAGYPINGVKTLYQWEYRKEFPVKAQFTMMKEAAKRRVALGDADFEYNKEKDVKK